MVGKWWLLPWVAWPAGFIIGFLSGIVANWTWEKLRRRLHGSKDYIDLSYSGDVMHFEGQQKVTVSAQELLAQIFQVEPQKREKPQLEKEKAETKMAGPSPSKRKDVEDVPRK